MQNYKVIHLGPIIQGTSKSTGQPWAIRDLLLEEIPDANVIYPNRFAATLSGTERIAALASLQPGDTLQAALFHNVREYDGHYYNQARITSFNINS